MIIRSNGELCAAILTVYLITITKGQNIEISTPCEPCWKGDTCSEEALSPPKFEKEYDSVTIPTTHFSGETIYEANATDEDQATCRQFRDCPCATLSYSIVSQDGETAFQIDKVSGALTVNDDVYKLKFPFHLTLGVSDDNANFDMMQLTVYLEESEADEAINSFGGIEDGFPGYSPEYYLMAESESNLGEPHHRAKRAITLPSEVTFTLTREGVNSALTSMKIGQRFEFKLEILFPSDPVQISVELFAPDGDQIIMMLCNVVVTKGSNLAITGSLDPVMDSMTSTNQYDRAVISLGTVTTGGDLSTEDVSKIIVTYEAVMVDNTATNGNTYYVSAGAEYNNANDVWVGQASIQADTPSDAGTTSSYQPSASMTGPSTLEVGQSAKYSMAVYIPYPWVDVVVDVYAPLNGTDILRVCGLEVVNISEAYQCSMLEPWDYTAVGAANGNTEGYGRMTLNLGKVINKYAREADDPTQLIYLDTLISVQDYDGNTGKDAWLGVAISMGTETIWAGQMKITITPKSVAATTTPTLTNQIVGNSAISLTTPVLIQLDVQLAEGSSADYTLEVMAPFNDSAAVFQVCAVSLASVGENMACTNSEIDPEYITTDNTSIYTDRAVINLGRIVNVGPWGWVNESNSATANTLTFNIVVSATEHPLATPGSTHKVLMGVFVGEDRLAVCTTDITVGSADPATAITTANKPTFSLSYQTGVSTVSIGESVKTLLNITTARNTIYMPFNVEFIMPNSSGQALLQICKVELQSVGRNNPCLVDKGVESGVQYMSSFNDGVLDRAVLSIPALCNTEMVDDVAEDTIVLAASMRVRQHPDIVGSISTQIDSGVQYSTAHVWVGQISLNIDDTPPASIVVTPPYIGVEVNNGNLTKVPNGYPARFLVRAKMAPGDMTNLLLEAQSTTEAISICSIRFVRAGLAYPCADFNSLTGNITQEEPLSVVQHAFMDLGYLSNVGADPFVADDRFDENSVEVEVIAKVATDPAVAPDNSELTFDLKLTYDGSSVQTATATVTVTSDVASVEAFTAAPADTTASLTVGSISGEDTPLPNEDLGTIVKTESKRFVLNVTTGFNMTSQLTVSIATPAAYPDTMEVLSIGLLDAGENIPCMNHDQGTATYEPRVIGGLYNENATLNLGFVCNTGSVTGVTEANTFRVEAIIRLLGTATVVSGDTLTIEASVMSHFQPVATATHSIVVGDETTYIDVHQDNATLVSGYGITLDTNLLTAPVTMTIAQEVVFPLKFSVPPHTSSKVIIDASMPVNTSAILTVKDMVVTGSGANIPNMGKYEAEFIDTEIHGFNTSQITKWQMDLGVVSNGGFSHRSNNTTPTDDEFTVDVTLQMADSAAATDASTHYVSFGLKVAKYIYVYDVQVIVSRIGETLEFNITSMVDEVNSTTTRVEIDTIFRLSDLSTNEGQDSILNIDLPPFVTYMSTIVTSPYKEILSTTNDKNSISLSFGPLFFTDIVYLTTVIETNSSYEVPTGVTGLDNVFAFQAVADTHDLTDVASELNYVNFSITTTPSVGGECTPAAMGMQSGGIADCQITSSRESQIGYEAIKARRGDASGWSPFVHAGKVRKERYLQVDFEQDVLVSEIILTQVSGSKVTSIGVKYSNDGKAWVENVANTLAVDVAQTESTLPIPNPEKSRFLRVLIKDTEDETAVGSYTFEFNGCALGTNVASHCSSTSLSYLPEFKMRTFLVVASEVYVCDAYKTSKGLQQRCYASSDSSTWRALDSRVGCMVGYDSNLENPRIYAIGSSGQVYLSSADGVTWATSNPADVAQAQKELTYKPAIEVPVDGDTRLKVSTPNTAFTDGTYGATIVGLKHDDGTWTEKFSWSTCC